MDTTPHTTATAIATALDGLRPDCEKLRFPRYAQFVAAVLAALPSDDAAARAYAEDVLATAEQSAGRSVAERIRYAQALVRHGCDDPLAR